MNMDYVSGEEKKSQNTKEWQIDENSNREDDNER